MNRTAPTNSPLHFTLPRILAVAALCSSLGGCTLENPQDRSPSAQASEPKAGTDSKPIPANSSEANSSESSSTTASETSETSETSEQDSPNKSGSSAPDDSGQSSTATPETPIELQLLISVDWEGGTLRDKNLLAMEKMRSDFPDIPLTHYLNAVYYTRKDAKKDEITKSIKRVIRDGDELGLHIHGWQSLFEAAGVEFRDGPRYLELNTERIGDVGYTVDIGSYPVEDLRKVIAFSVKTLEEQGLGRAVSFRSGGWMGRTNVLIALIREGFKRDASAVATQHFDDEFFTESVWYGWLTSLWPNMRADSQPFLKQVQDDKEMLTILEIPDNGALADYVKASEMVKVYQSCLAYKRVHPNEEVTMNFGFHDVNAFRYLERVTQGIEKIRALAKKDGVKIVPVTSETMKYTPARLRH